MSKNYQASETSTEWTDSGGDKLLDLGALVSDAVKMGAYLDLGASPRADWYEIVVVIDGFNGAPDLKRTIEIRMSQSNSTTNFDGQPTTDPQASVHGVITQEQARNCKLIGIVRTVSTTAGDILQARFASRLTSRYVSPIVINNTNETLNGTADAHSITLTPIPQESQ